MCVVADNGFRASALERPQGHLRNGARTPAEFKQENIMSQETLASGRAHFATAIQCASCGQTGSVDCETIDAPDRGGAARAVLIGMTEGFYRAPGASELDDPLIICNRCGAVQKDCVALSF
jgi:hypothetical protein